jgi:hypothetical protein
LTSFNRHLGYFTARLRIAYIRIGFINQGVQHLHGFPNPHAGALFAFEVYTRFDVEFKGLFRWYDV